MHHIADMQPRVPTLDSRAGEIPREDFTFVADDGHPLAASWYGERDASHVVLIAPATGVARRFYRAFARYLASEGFGVLSWDWRGIGESRPPSLRGYRATMREWGVLDLPAAIAAARARAADRPLVVVGHSFGGQSVGLAPNRAEVDALVLVAAQVGYWGLWPDARKWVLAGLWYLVLPTLAHTLGYVPGRVFGQGEDLPRDVALEWAGWCRRPEFLAEWDGHAEVRAPMLAWGISDDFFAPRPAVEALVAKYVASRPTVRHVTPRDLALSRIGHFGFFRSSARPLWEETARWIGTVERAGVSAR